MTENDRPLPTPPRSRFGRETQDGHDPATPLTSDRMTLAAAEGRLEEFLQHEIPPGDHARELAVMMMGMSGMMPMETPPGAPPALASQSPPAPAPEAEAAVPPEVPPEVRAAIQQGDVAGLMAILRAEHARRGGKGAPQDDAPPAPAPAAGERRAGIDAAVIDELIRIAADNDVTVDWLMLRAVKLYVAEYLKSGRL